MIPEEDFLRIAYVSGVHGLRGRLKISVVTDILERFAIGNEVLIGKEAGVHEYRIAEFAIAKNRSGLLKLNGIDDRDAALTFKGCEIFISKSIAENSRDLLEEECYYYYDIIGCTAIHKGAALGEITDILEAGSGDILIIQGAKGKKYMVPFVESMVDTSSINKRKIIINPVEGLLDI